MQCCAASGHSDTCRQIALDQRPLLETDGKSASYGRITGKLTLNYSKGYVQRENLHADPPGAKVNPGAAATGPGLDTNSSEADGATAYTSSRVLAQ